MNVNEKIDTVWNEIKKINKYTAPECIVFFEMNSYTFILKDDVDKLWKENLDWIKKDFGTIGEYKAIRLEKFDPNDIDNYFDDLMYRGYLPIRIIVKEKYWAEKDYVKN